MEIPETKRFFPKGLNWVQHQVSQIGLLSKFLKTLILNVNTTNTKQLSDLAWKNEAQSGVSKTVFKLPRYLMKHCIECLIQLLKGAMTF